MKERKKNPTHARAYTFSEGKKKLPCFFFFYFFVGRPLFFLFRLFWFFFGLVCGLSVLLLDGGMGRSSSFFQANKEAKPPAAGNQPWIVSTHRLASLDLIFDLYLLRLHVCFSPSCPVIVINNLSY